MAADLLPLLGDGGQPDLDACNLVYAQGYQLAFSNFLRQCPPSRAKGTIGLVGCQTKPLVLLGQMRLFERAMTCCATW
jgi:hypothetical protein